LPAPAGASSGTFGAPAVVSLPLSRPRRRAVSFFAPAFARRRSPGLVCPFGLYVPGSDVGQRAPGLFRPTSGARFFYCQIQLRGRLTRPPPPFALHRQLVDIVVQNLYPCVIMVKVAFQLIPGDFSDYYDTNLVRGYYNGFQYFLYDYSYVSARVVRSLSKI